MKNHLIFNTGLSTTNGNLHIDLIQQGYSAYSCGRGGQVAEFDTDSTFLLYFFPGTAHPQPRIVPAFSNIAGDDNEPG